MDLTELLEGVREVDIETAPGGRRTTIWPVVGSGSVFVRSLRGNDGRWYREAVAEPDVVLHVEGQAVPVRVVPTADDESVEQANAGYRRKYADSPAVAAMTRDEILPTTLRLDPR